MLYRSRKKIRSISARHKQENSLLHPSFSAAKDFLHLAEKTRLLTPQFHFDPRHSFTTGPHFARIYPLYHRGQSLLETSWITIDARGSVSNLGHQFDSWKLMVEKLRILWGYFDRKVIDITIRGEKRWVGGFEGKKIYYRVWYLIARVTRT